MSDARHFRLPRRAHRPALSSIGATMLVALMSAQGHAQLRKDLPVSESPPKMTASDLEESIQSTVTIMARENHELEEHRVGNNLYMVKVKPRNAPAYYLVDDDGSGNLQWRRGGALERTSVPRWAVLKW